MEYTRAKAVSRVLNELKLNNKDDYFPKRTILQMLEGKIKFLLAQKMSELSMYREDIYTHIPCLELEKVEVISCPVIEFRQCATLMRSKEKLPETISTKYFNDILNVTSIDTGKVFIAQSIRDYVLNKKRKYAYLKPLSYFKIDDRLYIPDHEVYAVNVDVLTLRIEEAEQLSGCKEYDCCKNYWDYPLTTSDRINEAVIKEVINELLGTARSIVKDENPDLDSNSKSQNTP